MANLPFDIKRNTLVSTKQVQVQMVENGVAHVLDQFGMLLSIPADHRMGKGALPQVGERWTISRDPGATAWVFQACLATVNPAIINEVPVGSSRDEMLTAMTNQGFITDTAPRVVDWSPWFT